jgi:concanavalin A-like lectin/glucanase superfamily protein
MKRYNQLLLGVFTFFVLFSCFTLFATQPHLQRGGVNLISNPTVNGLASYWYPINGAVYDSSVSRSADGSGSLKMSAVDNSFCSTLIPIEAGTAGTTYTLSFYMRSDAMPPAIPKVYVNFYSSKSWGALVRSIPSVGQSVTAAGEWQECVIHFRLLPGENHIVIHSFLGADSQPLTYAPRTAWIDDFYLGEGIGYEQPPAAKTPFNGAQTKIDALGNVEILKAGTWTPFFPIGIYTDGYRADWSLYSNQGFNLNMWANSSADIQKAKEATSALNPDGMMSGFQIVPYLAYGGSRYNDLTTLTSKINEIRNNGLMDSLLWYYWDNEAYSDWDVPLAVTNKIKELDVDTYDNRLHPIYALQGYEGIARKYNYGTVNMTDIVGDYVTKSLNEDIPETYRRAFGITALWNVEKQQNPVVMANLGYGIGLKFRPRVFDAIAKGAKGISFWMDDQDGTGDNAKSVDTCPWWGDLPNIRSEIDQLLPIIRMPHWTSWSLSPNNNLIDFGTRDYQGKGYVIVTNEQSTVQSVTFTVAGLPYAATSVKNFFTNQIEAQVANDQFTISIPAYGSKVYTILENNIEETLILKLLYNDIGASIAYDDSVLGNDGTLIGNASLDDGMLTLDGSGDYVNCGNDASLDIGTHDMTITARVKWDPSQKFYTGIVSKGATSAATPGYALFYRESNGGMLSFALANGSTSSWASSTTQLGLNDGQWHTVGVSVVRSGNATFYVDGAPAGSASVSNYSTSNIIGSYDLIVGSWGTYWNLQGQIDSVMIYQRALTQTEIIDLYSKTLDMSFNETSGNVLDSSTHSNDGTLIGNASLDDGMLTLDGSGDYVNCGNDASLDIGTQDITITARVKWDPSQKFYTGIVSKGATSAATPGYALFYRESNGGMLSFALANGSTSSWASSTTQLGLNDGQWHTVGVSVVRSGNATFYVDGVLAGSASVSNYSTSNIIGSYDLIVGSWGTYWNLQGQIDKIRIYTRALTAEEILTAQ